MKEKEITLTLTAPKQYFSELFGAVRLGVWLEDWCATLEQCSIDTADTRSYKWCMRVLWMLEQMQDNTGVKSEWKEYAQSEWAVSIIEEFVDKKGWEYINANKNKNEGLDNQNKMLNNDKDE